MKVFARDTLALRISCWKMASISHGDVQSVAAKVKILINAQLKQVLKREGLPVSGVKAAMQERIIRRKSQPVLTSSSILRIPSVLRSFIPSLCILDQINVIG